MSVLLAVAVMALDHADSVLLAAEVMALAEANCVLAGDVIALSDAECVTLAEAVANEAVSTPVTFAGHSCSTGEVNAPVDSAEAVW